MGCPESKPHWPESVAEASMSHGLGQGAIAGVHASHRESQDKLWGWFGPGSWDLGWTETALANS